MQAITTTGFTISCKYCNTKFIADLQCSVSYALPVFHANDNGIVVITFGNNDIEKRNSDRYYRNLTIVGTNSNGNCSHEYSTDSTENLMMTFNNTVLQF